MSLCINPHCSEPSHPGNDGSRFCQSCGSDLVLKERYRVMRLLSDKSGFGRVYEAYERNIPKILKVLKDVHGHNPKAVQLFEREAAVLSQLRNPGVPAIEAGGYFQFLPRGNTEPLHCIVMEKIDGPNLREWMRQQGNHPISESQALQWLRQLTEVLHLVHQHNYFHRDIKPENIMLRSNGRLVLVDFGAAREMTSTYLAQLGSSDGVTRISSAGYTPPEQEKGQAVPQSDFYALGWTFVYLLTGKQPTDAEIYNPLSDEFRWHQFAPQITSPLAAFIDRLIAPRASDRPPNTAEILRDLTALSGLSARPVAAALSPLTTAPPSLGSGQPLLTLPQPPETQLFQPGRWGWLKGKRWLIGGLAAVVLGLGGYLGWQAYQRSPDRSGTAQTLVVEQVLEGHTGFINYALFSPDGKNLMTASADHQIFVWDLETGQAVRVLQGHTGFVNVLALSGDGQTLVSGGADKKILIWDLPTGRLLHALTGHTNAINALAIASDGILVSGSADRTVRTWDLATGKPLQTLTGLDGFVNAVAVSPDARLVIAAGAAPSIQSWDLATGEPIRAFVGYNGTVNALTISPDGSTLIAGGTDKAIRLWDVSTGELMRTLTGHTGFINTLAAQGDGTTLLSSDAEGTLKRWDLTTDRPLQSYRGTGRSLDHVAVSPDWKAIATGRGSDTVQLWTLPEK